MIDPKTKAQMMVQEYMDAPFNCRGCTVPYCEAPCTQLNSVEAAKCALIAIRNIIGVVSTMADNTSHHLQVFEYWLEVRDELFDISKKI